MRPRKTLVSGRKAQDLAILYNEKGSGRSRSPEAIVLGEEHERRRVGRRPVLQLQLELAAGAGPGGVGLPAVGVVAGGAAEREPGSRARPAGRDRVWRPGRAADRDRARRAGGEDVRAAVALQAEAELDQVAGMHQVQLRARAVGDRAEEALPGVVDVVAAVDRGHVAGPVGGGDREGVVADR